MPICYPEGRCLIMDAYADYEFYIVNYRGKAVSETDFPVAALNATQFIRTLTVGRSDRYEGEEIKYATCAAAEAYAQAFRFSESEAETAEISTENTDGYSVSYVSQRQSGETQEALFKRKAYDAVRTWLSGTGLLNRRCGVMKW